MEKNDNKPLMTNEEYVLILKGKRCPYCCSKNFYNTGPVDVGDDRTAYQRMSCQTCCRVWYNRYLLVGFEPAESILTQGDSKMKEYRCKNCNYSLLLDEKKVNDDIQCPCCHTKFMGILVDPSVPHENTAKEKIEF